MANTWGDMQLDPTPTAATAVAPKTVVPALAGYTAATQAAPTVPTLGGYTAATGTAAPVPTLGGYTSAASTGATRDITAPETVSGQMTSLLSSSSPYMTQARTQAAQQSAAKGLLNTSMAVTAGEQAAIQSALPIAQADAAAYARAAEVNLANTQAAGMATTAALNEQRQYAAEALNKGTLTQAQFSQEMARLNTEATTQASQYLSEALNKGKLTQAQYDIEMIKTNLGATNAAKEYMAEALNKGTLTQAQYDAETAKLNAQISSQANELNAKLSFDAATAQLEANIAAFNTTADIETKKYMADKEREYNVLMQTSASASDIYMQVVKNMSDISTSSLSADAKLAAMENQKAYLDNAMKQLGIINSLSLGAIVAPVKP